MPIAFAIFLDVVLLNAFLVAFVSMGILVYKERDNKTFYGDPFKKHPFLHVLIGSSLATMMGIAVIFVSFALYLREP